MVEEWKPIPGYPGYEASSLGNVRSQRTVLAARKDKQGYRKVNLYLETRMHTMKNSVAVCMAFHGKRPSRHHLVAHRNDVKDDDRVENLRWATYKENIEDRVKNGRDYYGENNPKAKLSWEDVDEIRRLCAEGVRHDQIGAKFGISKQYVSKIKCNKFWVRGAGSDVVLAEGGVEVPGSS